MTAILAPDLEHIFAPLEVASVTLRNRIVMPAMQRGWCDLGTPKPELAEYYRRRAEGGVALIISESCAIDHVSATAQPMAAKLSRQTASAWRDCIASVKAAGGRMLVQLWHEGALRNNADGATLSPSGSGHSGHENGRAASLDELADIKQAYVEAARLAQDLGADGVELHSAHGYFLDQFLWPVTNRRTDKYGGPDITDRARFPLEIVEGVRAACGRDFIISFRFSQWKEHDYEARIVESPEGLGVMLAELKSAGVDMFHASTRRYWEAAWQGSPLPLAAWVKHFSGLPTVAVGSVGLDRDVMESFTSDGEASSKVELSLRDINKRIGDDQFDLIAVGRSLISDPDWAAKVKSGEFEKIRTFAKKDIEYLDWEI